MHVHRLTKSAAATLFACALLSGLTFSAFAQTPDTAYSAAAPQAETDPPGRVARLNYMAGTVTSEPAGASDWSYAQINRPLTTGDQLWNDEGARSELHIGSTAVRLGSSTSLEVLSLDDASAQLKVAQGTLSTRVRSLPPGGAYEIDTPNAALGVTAPGDYRVDVAPDGSRTTVTVRSGSLTAYGDGGALPISAGQQITFAGTALQQVAANGAPAADSFDQWAASRDAAEDQSVSARYVSRDIPGYQDLDANGTWQTDPSYGEVWVPNAVAADWAPYRQGHWVWQAPWGWTWVDDAPWGFAPYHYGRWAYAGSRWAWVPGPLVETAPPAYAPALVAFVGDGGGGVDWNVGLAIGGAAAVGVAWFPLGPGEPWRGHRDGWSPRYYDRVNRNVHVDQSVHIRNTYVNYRAPGAVTAVPATAFVRGRPVGRENVRVDPAHWRSPRFTEGGPGIAPTRDSFTPGLRRADYRPPQGAFGRPVVATRAPLAPPAFHDTFAQRLALGQGARVAGAGNPVVRAAPEASAGRNPGSRAPQMQASPGRENIHLVATHGPARALENAGIASRGPNGATGPSIATPPQRDGGHAPPIATDSSRNGGVPRPPQVAQWGNGPAQQAGHSAPAHDMNQPQPGGLQHAPQMSNGAQQRGNQMATSPGGLSPRDAGVAPQPSRFAGQPAHEPNGAPQRDASAVPRPPAHVGQPPVGNAMQAPAGGEQHLPHAMSPQQPQQWPQQPQVAAVAQPRQNFDAAQGRSQAPRSQPVQQAQNGFQPAPAHALQPVSVPQPRPAPIQTTRPDNHPQPVQQAQNGFQPTSPREPQSANVPQPRQDFHATQTPAPAQAARPENHPQQVQQPPRQEIHPPPQQVQQTPRQEFHPPPPQQQAQQAPRQQVQPHQEVHQAPRPQPQPAQPQHQEPHAAGNGNDQHHRS